MENIKKIFEDFDIHLMNDEKPSKYFNKLLKDTDIFHKTFPFTMLGDLIKTEQNLVHHPEGNVWNHTMMVVDNAAEKKNLTDNPRELLWAALLHDLGKAPTTKLRKGRLTSYDHDKVGKKLAIEFLREFTDDEEFINNIAVLVRWHMQILFVVKNLPFAEIEKMTSEISPDEVALLGLCDRLGRGEMTEQKRRDEEKNIKIFIDKTRKHYNKNK